MVVPARDAPEDAKAAPEPLSVAPLPTAVEAPGESLPPEEVMDAALFAYEAEHDPDSLAAAFEAGAVETEAESEAGVLFTLTGFERFSVEGLEANAHYWEDAARKNEFLPDQVEIVNRVRASNPLVNDTPLAITAGV